MSRIGWKAAIVALVLGLAVVPAVTPSSAAQAAFDLASGDILFTVNNSIVKLDAPGNGRSIKLTPHPQPDPDDGIALGLRDLIVDGGDIFVLDNGESQTFDFKPQGRILQIHPDGSYTVIGNCQGKLVNGESLRKADLGPGEFHNPEAVLACFEDAFGLARLGGKTSAGNQFVVTNPRRDGQHIADGEVWLVNPAGRTLLSSGGELFDPHHVTVDPVTDLIYVAEHNGSQRAAVIGIDPVNGTQVVIAQGGPLEAQNGAVGIANDPIGGGLVVSTIDFGLIRVDPGNPSTDGSNQTVIMPKTGQMQLLTGVSVDSRGRIAVTDQGAFDFTGALFLADPPARGARILYNRSRDDCCGVNGFVEIVR